MIPTGLQENVPSDDEAATLSSDDSSEMSPEINLSRYSQNPPLWQTPTSLQGTLDQCDSNSKCHVEIDTPSSEDTLLSSNTLLPSDSDSEKEEYHSTHFTPTGASFALNQLGNANNSMPSLFSRKQYVTDIIDNESAAGNEVLFVIISTYGLDEVSFLREIPSLMGGTSTIPTLILYGKKVSPATKRASALARETAWLNDKSNISPFLCLVRVQPRHRNASFMGYADKGKGILGVHHPKYILIFTRRGLHVMVSTANMTPQVRAAEGTYTHYFPAFTQQEKKQRGEEKDKRGGHGVNDVRKNNDFGEVLDDFLNKVHSKIQCTVNIIKNNNIYVCVYFSITCI